MHVYNRSIKSIYKSNIIINELNIPREQERPEEET